MNKKFNLKDWVWVLYPILTAVFMVISLNFLMGSGAESMLSIISTQSENAEKEKNLAQLKIKLDLLMNTDKQDSTEKLKKLLAAMPPAKRIWYLLEAINRSATSSGMEIVEYGGIVGEVKEASESATISAQAKNPDAPDTMTLKISYKPTSFDSLYKMISEMENYLPLIKIVKASYGMDKITLTIDGAWGQFVKPSKNIIAPLPVYQENLNKTLSIIQGMNDLTAEDN
jgi:hypothetical protein